MCRVAELLIPSSQWMAAVPPHLVNLSTTSAAYPGKYISLRAQACRGHLLAAPRGTPDDPRHGGWIDLGPMDDLPDPKRSVTRLVWAAWLEQVGWG